MRWTLLVAVLFAESSFASDPGSTRPATTIEAGFVYLGTLNSTPVDEAVEMLADGGVDDTHARKLLTYLDEQFDRLRHQGIADAAGLCRNLDGRFSRPLALARELVRQREAEQEFQSTVVAEAEAILGVDSLETVVRPHMNRPGIVEGPDVVDLVLTGQLTPASAIARACEVTQKDGAGVLDRSDAT